MSKSFKEAYIEPIENNNTLIVDSLNLAFRWKHQGRSDFRFEFEQTVNSLARSYNCSKIIIAADWGSSTYRREIYPEYKADRAEKYKDQTEQDKIAFEEFFEEYEATLELLRNDYIVFRYKGVEADDIAAHLVRYKDKYGLGQIWLISSDRDWDLLIQEDVSRFSTVTRKEITLKEWPYEVTPEMYITYKCLTGDKGDNIPGITQIGPKRASQVIAQYGDGFDIYSSLPIDSHYAYIKNLNASGELILTNYKLMDLMTYCDEAIGEENLQDIRVTMGDIPW